MSKLTIKSRPVTEANDYANFGEAYRDFVKRCYTGQKPNYSEKAINFMLDCAHIANGTPGNGLTPQGFKLTKANNVDMIGDCLHLCYESDDRSKSVDVWLNPHSHTAMLDLYGFNPERPHSSTHKEFTSDKHTADDFYEFIKNLSDYKGESKTGESKMKKCSMQKKKESLGEARKSNKAKALAELSDYFGRTPDGNTIHTPTLSREDEIEIGNICDKYGVDFALGTSHVTIFGKGESKKNEKDDYPDDYYTWADEKVDDEYADESGIFFEVVDDMMRLAESMAEDIISEQGLEDTEKTKEDLKDVIYDRMCDTMVNMFGGVSRNNL